MNDQRTKLLHFRYENEKVDWGWVRKCWVKDKKVIRDPKK